MGILTIKLRKKGFDVIIFIVVFFASTLLVSPAHSAGPWKGRIIDIETKEPIEGAVVLAVWMRAYRTPAGDNTYFYNAKEAVTDKEGKFEIPEYTPINPLPIISYIREPEFTIFKPGYLSLSSVGFGDFFLEGTKEEPLERKHYNGMTFKLAPGLIELPKLKTREERIKSLNDVEGFPIDDAPSYKVKHLLELIDQENRSLGFKK